ncbi:MAG: galactosyltransferase-related protein [Synechococcaceae cyanobacterium ELA739]
MREQLGVWLKDRWRYERALCGPEERLLGLCNRLETLDPAPEGLGYSCRWAFTSQLHAPKVQPRLGQRLLQRCLEHAPIVRSTIPPLSQRDPQISVLIGHRGLERLPLLSITLESLAAQLHVRFECLVIEHDTSVTIADHLPAWVRHVHDVTEPDTPYNRSQAFNVGALHAKAPVLLLHDNDMLVPAEYLYRILHRLSLGYAVVNPKRYVFYLSQSHTQALLSDETDLSLYPPESIVQNLEAGGSMAITRVAYNELGGMDESFVGWGGEDNEFWDRCLTLPTWIWGYEPIVHLWHSSQPAKSQFKNPNLDLLSDKLKLPVAVRIASLIGKSRTASF